MNSEKPTQLLAGAIAALITLGLAAVPGNAFAASGGTVAVQIADDRQLIGVVSTSTYLEASVPASGTYLFEYEISGVAFFDTYVNGAELGYVGGSDGIYRTRASQLSAGGQLIQVVGPEGSGTARVYLVHLST